MKNKSKKVILSEEKQSRREFLKRGGRTFLIAEGLIIGGGALLTGLEGCEPDDETETNGY